MRSGIKVFLDHKKKRFKVGLEYSHITLSYSQNSNLSQLLKSLHNTHI